MGTKWRILLGIVALGFPAGCSGSVGGAPEPTTSLARQVPQLRTTEASVVIPADGTAAPLNVYVVMPVGRGPFPLVVFNHGAGSIAEIYRPVMEHLAANGYVVAGPNFPTSDHTTQPGYVTRVIDDLAGPTSSLPRGLVDADRIAVAGHSLGGAGVYGVAYNSCCRDPRIDAALTFESPLLDFSSGTYSWEGPSLLIVLGDADPVVAVDTGQTILEQFSGPNAYLLTVKGGGHGGGLHENDVGFEAVQRVVADFLAANLKDDQVAARTLRATTKLGPATLQRSDTGT